MHRNSKKSVAPQIEENRYWSCKLRVWCEIKCVKLSAKSRLIAESSKYKRLKMEKLVLVVHVLAALGVIGLVLLQHGKGADMGASFGSGASGSLFGVSGSSNFMSRATAIFVIVFFSTSLTLAYMASDKAGGGSVVKAHVTQTEANKAAPVATDVSKTETPATEVVPK